MSEKTVLVFEYTPAIEECPECGKDVYVDVLCDSIGQPYRLWACQFCEWHEDLGDWIRLSKDDYWDWMCFPALSDESQWELKTRRVVKE
jgi:predicted RNA-binding Zn-ribbon protein involved in translation (DUF1610 family)